MKYVDMDEVAFDSASVALPGLGNCHGIVYVNDYGMFAYHARGNPWDIVGKIEAFGMFVRNHAQGGAKGVCLYGACPTNRHPEGDRDHQKELMMVADAIRFGGPIKGCGWDLKKLGWTTTYVEYQLNRTEVTIQIADFSSGTSQRGSNKNALSHKVGKQVKWGVGPED